MAIEDHFRAIIQEEVDGLKQFISDALAQQRDPEVARYLTRKQVAKYLGIGLSTVDYWTKIGKLNKADVFGAVRFDRHSIDENIKTLRKYNVV